MSNKKRIAMKKEKKNRTLMGSSLAILAILSAALVLSVSSCSNSGKITPNNENEVSALQSEPLPDDDQVYLEVDELPVFKGGEAGLLKYVAENTKYPEEAKKNNITGKVLLKFVVEKDGSVSNVSVLQGVNYLLDSAAFQVVSSLPRFEKPARKNGQDVAVQFMLPVTFALK
jgi:TonB family protein